MHFGHSLLLCRTGKRIARAGWNGKDMFLFYVDKWNYDSALEYDVLPFIAMKTADNKIVPWLASQTDILATDWELV